MSALGQQQADLFRRRRFEAPHKQPHPFVRLLRPFAAALAAVGIPAAAAWWVATSPQFEIRSIATAASAHVAEDWMAERLAALSGRHLLTVRLADVERLLGGHPWIADLVVRRELPGRLAVEVIERVPAALWSDAEGLIILDASGRRIAPLAGDSGALDLPVISAAVALDGAGGAAADAIRLARRWESLRPGDQVSQVEILRSRDFRLVTAALPFTLVVGADRLEAAHAALERARPLIEGDRLPTLPMSAVASVDLRFSRQIVFQPAAPEPPGKEG